MTNALWAGRVELNIYCANDGCKIAVIPKILPDGTPAWDCAKYYDFGETGSDINGYCIAINQSGGVEDIGLENNLVVILYAPGSPYDQYVSAQRAAGRPVFADRNGMPLGDPVALNPTVSNQAGNQGATGASMAGPIMGTQRAIAGAAD
ncbi:hypothetical protein MMC14_010099 [Varicellaria rhodocarpa]|nr:hypothetical protein [Varicellaria rhodocarpa]